MARPGPQHLGRDALAEERLLVGQRQGQVRATFAVGGDGQPQEEAARRQVDVHEQVKQAAAREVGGRAEEVVVLRACYLAVRRTGSLPSTSRLVVIEEPGRALRATDVAAAVGVPVWCRLSLDPAVARSVDAGLLGARLPRSLRGLDLAR